MNIITIIKNIRWRIPVYTFWLTVIVKLLVTGESSYFLRPEFTYILALGGLTLLFFLIFACLSDSSSKHSMGNFLHLAIMLLPLFYYLNAQGEFLGRQAYAKRQTGLPTIASSTADQIQDTEDSSILLEDNEEVIDVPTDDMQIYQNPAQFDRNTDELTILDLYDDPDDFIGKSVTVKGMIHKDDEDIAQEFGRNIPLLFRFVITCCAADAIPAGLLIDSSNYSNYQEGDWVEVQGIFASIDHNGENIPIIKTPTLTKTEAPENPYLY